MNIALVMTPAIFSAGARFGYMPAGLCTMQGVLKSAGHVTTMHDLSVDLLEQEKSQNLDYNIHEYFRYDYKNDFDYLSDVADKIISQWVNEIIETDPDWVCFGSMGADHLRGIRLLAIALKKRLPDIMIAVGGTGVMSVDRFTAYLNEDIIDYVIEGPGEIALLEAFKGNDSYPGINYNAPYKPIVLDDTPFRDFTGIDESLYVDTDLGYDFPTYPITGSYGCVYDCSFCDVRTMWPKFQYRSDDRILAEIKNGVEKFNARLFSFTDSVFNASMPNTRRLLYKIIKYRNSLPSDKTFMWDAFGYVIKPRSKLHDSDFELLSRAGVNRIGVGIESGSEKVRRDMGKNFSNDDIYYNVSQCYKNKVSIQLGNMVGYLTETEKDFQETLDLYTRLEPFKEFMYVRTGVPFALTNNTKVDLNPVKYKLVNLPGGVRTADNPTNTLLERFRRNIRLSHHIDSLGYRTHMTKHHLSFITTEYLRLTNRTTADIGLGLISPHGGQINKNEFSFYDLYNLMMNDLTGGI